jgi:cobalamin biosynthetic protein CobC
MVASISRASRASAAVMISHADGAPLVHGGDLDAARRLFPGAPEPFIDLSTGINPYAYPIPELSPDVFARLPQSAAINRLCAVAARAYGAPAAAHVVAAPGTQILLPMVASLVPPGRAAVLGPTYGEYVRVAALAGHAVTEVAGIEQLENADVAFLANPNNPDGRMTATETLVALARRVRARNGLLVVDEAFMDVGPPDASLAAEITGGNIVVLRSFGKFFGLAGLRLGFALAEAETAAQLNALLGPWAITGPTLAVAETALADRTWADATRVRLAAAAERLDQLLIRSGATIVGGTSLFRLARTPSAPALFDRLGRNGILVRRFPDQPAWLRFGLPASEPEWRRLHGALMPADCATPARTQSD